MQVGHSEIFLKQFFIGGPYTYLAYPLFPHLPFEFVHLFMVMKRKNIECVSHPSTFICLYRNELYLTKILSPSG
jgi:hypothetical protein